MNKTEYAKAIAERLYNDGNQIYMEIRDFIPVHNKKMNRRFPISAEYVTAEKYGDEITLVFTKEKNTSLTWKANIKDEYLKKMYGNMPKPQPKQVVYVVIQDSVVDYDQTTRILMTTLDIEKAKKCLKENVDQIMETIGDNCYSYEWIMETDTDIEFGIYEDGCAAENHEYIWIKESVLQ
jgi:hypothetical protein